MERTTENDRLIRFSTFELDPRSGELFKQGRKVKLQGQPFELLVALLERPGEVLTREELRQKIWPSEVAGDFDQGLNRAINKVREALGDSADSPRFIETIPRRGYRFIGPVQESAVISDPVVPDAPVVPDTRVVPDAPVEAPKPKARERAWVALAVAAAAIAGITWWTATHRTPEKKQLVLQQLTANSADDPVWHAVISPDGRYLAYGDLAGIEVRLLDTGETHLFPRPPEVAPDDPWFPAAWFPDGTRVVATSISHTIKTAWTISVIGGAAAPLREGALVQSISPDGSLIAFTSERIVPNPTSGTWWVNDIWVMDSRGGNARKIVASDGLTFFGSVRWAPEGKRIAYQRWQYAWPKPMAYSIDTRVLNGGPVSSLISNVATTRGESSYIDTEGDFAWLPDGRVIYSASGKAQDSRSGEIWQVSVDRRTAKALGPAQSIASLPFHVWGFNLSADGKKLVCESASDLSRIVVGRFGDGGRLTDLRRLTNTNRWNLPYDWTADSKSVLFISDRSGEYAIYKQALDQPMPQLIPTGPGSPFLARTSPDGRFVIYGLVPEQGSPFPLMHVSLSGRPPEKIFDSDGYANFDCPRRPGAACVASKSTSSSLQFLSFDPISGKRTELFRLTSDLNPRGAWTISPDGDHLAILGAVNSGRIQIRSLTGKLDRTIEVNGWTDISGIDWTADGKSLFGAANGLADAHSGAIAATILHIGLDGRVQPLWETRGGRQTWAIASPDGKYLAIMEPGTERNAWMIENF